MTVHACVLYDLLHDAGSNSDDGGSIRVVTRASRRIQEGWKYSGGATRGPGKAIKVDCLFLQTASVHVFMCRRAPEVPTPLLALSRVEIKTNNKKDEGADQGKSPAFRSGPQRNVSVLAVAMAMERENTLQKRGKKKHSLLAI